MHDRSSKTKRSWDLSQLDEIVTGKNPHAAALGRLGGQKGGPARAMKLTAERRREIAKLAANARWHNEQDQQISESE